MARTFADLVEPLLKISNNTAQTISSGTEVAVERFHNELITLSLVSLLIFTISFGFFLGVMFSHYKQKNRKSSFWFGTYFIFKYSLIFLAIFNYVYIETFYAIFVSIYSIVLFVFLLTGHAMNNHMEGHRVNTKILGYTSPKVSFALFIIVSIIWSYAYYNGTKVVNLESPPPMPKLEG